jgi:hypothetical protein
MRHPPDLWDLLMWTAAGLCLFVWAGLIALVVFLVKELFG